MNKAFIKNQSVAVAGKWNELSREQLLRLVQVIYTPGATEAFVDTRLVAILLQLWKRPQLAGIMRTMPLLDVAELRLLTRAFLQQPVQLTRDVLEKIKVGHLRTAWLGPGDNMASITFEEWITCEDAYFRFRKSGDQQLLRRLVATLYRPAGRKRQANGDRRTEFLAHELDQRAAQLESTPQHVMQAVLFFYDSCRAQVVARYPELFPSDEELEYRGLTREAPTNPTRNYQLLVRELAGSPDRFALIAQQDLNNVFFDLNERMAEANAMAEELENRRNG